MTATPTIATHPADSVLADLYQKALQVDPIARQGANAQGLDEHHPGFYAAMHDAYMPVTPEFGKLLYLLARGARARTIVEYGTSFGISTIFLAAALRDNGGGTLVSTELERVKAVRAREHLAAAGLADLVEIRVGDAMLTLSRDLPASIDLLFLDGPKATYLALLRLLEHRLPVGALIASDNTDMIGSRDYLAYTRATENGYVSVALSTTALERRFDHELLVRAR